MKHLRLAIIFLLLACAQSSFGLLHLVLTQGVRGAIPIALVPFAQRGISTDVSAVIKADLHNSGQFNVVSQGDQQHQPYRAANVQFNYWQAQHASYLIIGSVTRQPNRQLKISYALLDIYKAKDSDQAVLLQQSVIAAQDNWRAAAHRVSDALYQKILGQPGIFSTKLAYVVAKRQRSRPSYQLLVADYDGMDPQTIVSASQPIMSPAWSPDGHKLAYVSFEHGLPAIYITDLRNGKRQLITNFPGINGAPAFSPDGSQLAVVLSRGQSPNIYTVNLTSGKIRQLTRGRAINTEPSWAPDGRSIVFTSDRGGAPQIYRVNVVTKSVKRLTFKGNYNAHASFTPNGEQLLLLHRGSLTNNRFGIGLYDLQSGVVQVLSADSDESPSMAPNGKLIVYATRARSGQSELAMVSTDGQIHLQLPSGSGIVREPAWSPFFHLVS